MLTLYFAYYNFAGVTKMSRKFKSKIGMLIVGFYLLLVGVAIIGTMTTSDDSPGLALIFLAMPWSLVLFDALHFPLPILGIALYGFCVVLNAAIFYLFGLLIRFLFSLFETPQD